MTFLKDLPSVYPPTPIVMITFLCTPHPPFFWELYTLVSWSLDQYMCTYHNSLVIWAGAKVLNCYYSSQMWSARGNYLLSMRTECKCFISFFERRVEFSSTIMSLLPSHIQKYFLEWEREWHSSWSSGDCAQLKLIYNTACRSCVVEPANVIHLGAFSQQKRKCLQP